MCKQNCRQTRNGRYPMSDLYIDPSRGNKMSSNSNSNNPQPQQKQLKQQILHPSLFIRQRSSSLTDLGMVTQNHQTAITVPVNETSISREVMSQEDNHYIAPPPWQSNLPLDPSDETCSSNVIKPSKPPPIVLNGIEDVNELSKLLQTASDKVNFKFKLINKTYSTSSSAPQKSTRRS
ncbi:hypothetical protein EVAR_8012_1 [Eumeta japonica]|uniref:Uncharacterized protein n=1 Tax=Eumeta variegata TaxID=151549 RepID=A0A4C1TKG3_EUMVA|nr:hypothetical protein EVAR_8012_1 [Eumeta japonica]